MSAVRRALAALLLAAACAGPALASTEEFSTFDVVRQEADDESFIDHVLTRYPAEWRDEWESSPNTFRTAQGCLTSGQWFMLNELELRSAMGRRSWLDLQLLQRVDNEAEYDWLQFEFRSPMWDAPGVWGFRFRPSFDKSRQDFALLWDRGSDSSRVQVHAVFGLEDGFNKLWAFRQTQVGEASKPYERHPFEPSLRAVWRTGDAARPARLRPNAWALARGTRLEAEGQWLTPGRQRSEAADRTVLERTSLWGAKGHATLEARLGAAGGELRFENVQAASTRALPPFALDGATYRRRWCAEAAVSARLSPRWVAEARWAYQDRTQTWSPPAGAGSFRALDRLAMASVRWRVREDWRARFGFMRDRVGVGGSAPVSGFGTRFETRAFLELQARFGRVIVRGVEGIELDREPYEVSFHHDKGFLHLQTTF